MTEAIREFIPVLACPACRRPELIEAAPRVALRCAECGQTYPCDTDIWDFQVREAPNAFEDESRQQAYYDEGAADTLEPGRNIPCHRNKIDGILTAAETLSRGGGLRTVCEVGVGTALHAAWFIGLDLSRRVLLNGRARWSRFPRFLAVLGSAYRLPLGDGAVDLLYYSGTLHHCEHPAEAIAEASRAIRPGGLLVLSEPVWYFPANLYFNLRIPEEFGQRKLRRGAMAGWCRDAGLDVEAIEHFNFVPHPRRLRRLTAGIEAAMKRVPLCNRFSSMFRFVARKR